MKQGKINLAEIEVGDVFSEESHYVLKGKSKGMNQFTHLESGQVVNLDDKYVQDLLVTADQYDKEVEVGKEDKYWTAAQIKKEGRTDVREGDLKQKGIRSIWADIHSAKVFTVNFNKQGKDLSSKQLEEERNKQIAEVVEAIEKAQKSKKSISTAAKEALKKVIENPVNTYKPGDERTLRGYKIQFSSVDGKYDVIDMDITSGMNQRQVNVNAINWLVVDNVKYIVK